MLLAQTLLDSEAAGKAVDCSIAVGPTSGQNKASTKILESNPAWALRQAIADESVLVKRTEGIMSHVDALRKETERTRSDIVKRKASNLKHRSDLKSATLAAQREAEALESVKKGVERMERRWDILHTRTMESRVFLCREAAQLYGLQQRIKKKAGSVRDIYMIGGVPIPDLRDLNSKYLPLNYQEWRLIFLRCLPSPCYYFQYQPSTSVTSGITLPWYPSPRRNHP